MLRLNDRQNQIWSSNQKMIIKLFNYYSINFHIYSPTVDDSCWLLLKPRQYNHQQSMKPPDHRQSSRSLIIFFSFFPTLSSFSSCSILQHILLSIFPLLVFSVLLSSLFSLPSFIASLFCPFFLVMQSKTYLTLHFPPSTSIIHPSHFSL